jgi:hypothetical protein
VILQFLFGVRIEIELKKKRFLILKNPTGGVNIAGIRLREINDTAGTENDPENWNECHKDVVNAAYEVIKLKGNRCYYFHFY